MAVFDITAFAGTSLVTTNRCMVSMQDTRPILNQMGYLENGAKFDAGGTADATLVLGQVRARYLCLPTGGGVRALNGHVGVLEGLRGKAGTLTGVQYGTNDLTLTCTARCVDVTTEEHVSGQNPPQNATNKQFAYVTVVWEKKTEWVAISGQGQPDES